MNVLTIFSEIIINAGVANGFLFAILFSNNKNQPSRILLSLLLMNISVIIFRMHYLLYHFHEKLGSPFFLHGPFTFLLGPLLFFYLRSIVIPGSIINRKDLKHFGLFAVFLLMFISLYFYGKDGAYFQFIQRVSGSPSIFLVLQFGYYLIQTHRLLRMHRENIVEKFSNVEGMDVAWLKFIIWVFVLILIFIAIATPLLIHGINFLAYKTTSTLFFCFILFFIAYKGIQQRVPMELSVVSENESTTADTESVRTLKEKLLIHMATNKPFLNPELTLSDLAKQISISRNQLSQVINTGTGDNFYNFVNKFRIEEVKALIKKDVNKKFNILSLAKDAGFNSKSSFNNIFKKMTGLTPSEYRNG